MNAFCPSVASLCAIIPLLVVTLCSWWSRLRLFAQLSQSEMEAAVAGTIETLRKALGTAVDRAGATPGEVLTAKQVFVMYFAVHHAMRHVLPPFSLPPSRLPAKPLTFTRVWWFSCLFCDEGEIGRAVRFVHANAGGVR